MKIIYILLMFFGLLFLSNCVSYDSTANNSSSSNLQNTTRTNRNNGVQAYRLARGEELATFITAQNRLNEYAKHENIPTELRFREAFAEYEREAIKIFRENRNNATENEKREFKDEYGITIDEFIDIFTRIGFAYKIEYNERTRVWHLELIGRSTTLIVDMAQTRRDGMSYYHNVIPYINRWMELNNVSDLDAIMRIYINQVDENMELELFGVPFNFDE